MRKLGARSMAVALLVTVIGGCSSTGGTKSFSWSSLNPMTYFAKSDSDSPIPKPSEQMAPTVTLDSASDVASMGGSSGGLAPPSPYGTASLGATAPPSSAMTPQKGSYDPYGYSSGGPSQSQLSSGYSSYSAQGPASYSGYGAPSTGGGDYQPPTGGYQLPTNPGYDAGSAAQYALGGGSYDIQGQSQENASGYPAYANPNLPYASNAAPYGGSAGSASPYQTPPYNAPSSGYDSGLAQDPYGSVTPPYPGTSMNSTDVGGNTNDAYAGSSLANRADSGSVADVASLPQYPPVPGDYSNTQPPYEPGNTGYNPPNVPKYSPPMPGGYVQPATATEPNFTPGSISRYPSTTSQSPAPTNGASSYGSTGSAY